MVNGHLRQTKIEPTLKWQTQKLPENALRSYRKTHWSEKLMRKFREIRNVEFLEAQKCRFRKKFQKLPENAKRN